MIGVLDIFGFEIFEINRFEQFLINFANEKLQQHFNHFVFELEQEEYKAEGLELPYVEFKDNKLCLAMIEKHRTGVLGVLDEEIRLPNGSDSNFLQRLHKAQMGCRYYRKPRMQVEQFTVVHYAGDVTYDVAGFLEKNKDKLGEGLLAVLQSSHKPFVSALVKEQDLPVEPSRSFPSKGGAGVGQHPKGKTLGAQFKAQLESLMLKLQSTQPHFIRCIKPNSSKQPDALDSVMTVRQLRYAGIQAVVKVRQQGFPFRLTHQHFMRRYGLLAGGEVPAPDDSEELKLPEEDRPVAEHSVWGGACAALAKHLDFSPTSFGVGFTKMFTTHEKHLQLEHARDGMIKKTAVFLQSLFRAKRAKSHFNRLLASKRRLDTALNDCQQQPLQLSLDQKFRSEISAALAEAVQVSVPGWLPVVASVQHFHTALAKKEELRLGLASAVQSEAQDVCVYDKALQAAKEGGDDVMGLNEYSECQDVRAFVVSEIERKKREEEERKEQERLAAIAAEKARIEAERAEEERKRKEEEDIRSGLAAKRAEEEAARKEQERMAREEEEREKMERQRMEQEAKEKEQREVEAREQMINFEVAKRLQAAEEERQAKKAAKKEAKRVQREQQDLLEAQAAAAAAVASPAPGNKKQSVKRHSSSSSSSCSSSTDSSEVTELRQKLTEANEQIQSMEELYKEINEHLFEKLAAADVYKKNVKKMEEEYIKSISKLEQKVATLEKTNQVAGQGTTSSSSALEQNSDKQRIQVLEEENAQKMTDFIHKCNEFLKLKLSYDDLKHSKSTYKKQARRLQEENKVLRQNTADQQDLKDLQAVIKDKDKIITAVQNEMNAIAQENARLQDQLKIFKTGTVRI